ncbi:hypothetical protein HMI54_011200 [Coelomomyces lativittatus]|nr:hypothetical protein HMI54_011200 [Coelomomyces lativittatus]KAJ1500164.1 hypothetical protein HMI56_003989 [Coelomomyces lativittatus]
MPMVNIVGITTTNNTFNAAFTFIHNETEAMYIWALQAFQKVTTPSIVVTDWELALISAPDVLFPRA